MLPLALILQAKGHTVSGSDRALDQGRTAQKFDFLRARGMMLYPQDGSGITRPDLIVVDISLNSGNGFDVLRALQEQKLVPAAIKVVLTNHASAEYENLSLSLGANRFFDKSSETSQVLALINVLAAERRHGGNRPHGSRHDPGNHSTQN